MPEPGNSDALSAREICDAFAQRIDTTDDLMARDQRQSGGRKIAARDMQVRTTDAAGFHPHPDLAGARDRIRPLFTFEATACLMKHHRAHGLTNSLRRGSCSKVFGYRDDSMLHEILRQFGDNRLLSLGREMIAKSLYDGRRRNEDQPFESRFVQQPR